MYQHVPLIFILSTRGGKFFLGGGDTRRIFCSSSWTPWPPYGGKKTSRCTLYFSGGRHKPPLSTCDRTNLPNSSERSLSWTCEKSSPFCWHWETTTICVSLWKQGSTCTLERRCSRRQEEMHSGGFKWKNKKINVGLRCQTEWHFTAPWLNKPNTGGERFCSLTTNQGSRTNGKQGKCAIRNARGERKKGNRDRNNWNGPQGDEKERFKGGERCTWLPDHFIQNREYTRLWKKKGTSLNRGILTESHQLNPTQNRKFVVHMTFLELHDNTAQTTAPHSLCGKIQVFTSPLRSLSDLKLNDLHLPVELVPPPQLTLLA